MIQLSTPTYLSRKVGLVTMLSVALSTAPSCSPTPPGKCGNRCSDEQICTESGECISPQLPHFDGRDVPGRHLRLLFLQDRVVTASVSPDTGRVVLGEGRRGSDFLFGEVDAVGKDPTETKAPPITNSGVAVVSDDTRAYVVWVARDGHFRIATKTATSGDLRWEFVRVELGRNTDYTATPQFTVTLTSKKTLLIPYHDASGDLVALEHDADLSVGVWEKVPVVTRADAMLAAGCIRQTTGRGVGLYPSATGAPFTTSTSDVYISHFDADCGSLLLSERVGGSWRTTLVDEGSRLYVPAHTKTRSRVGRMSSVKVTMSGDVAIAYYDEILGRLKYATRPPHGIWRNLVVDDGEEVSTDATTTLSRVGAYPTLDLSPDGPVITYQDATHHRVRMASQRGFGGWVRQSVDSRGIVGFFSTQAYRPDVGRVIGTEVLERRNKKYISRLRLIWLD